MILATILSEISICNTNQKSIGTIFLMILNEKIIFFPSMIDNDRLNY